MKIIEHEQGSPEWLKWRQSGLGASDIPVILGSNPYKTKLQLWEDKCGFGKETELNEAMKHGIKNEENARKWVNNELKLNLRPLCIEDDNNAFMMASLDGWDDSDKILVEIKCPTSIETIMKAIMEGKIHKYWIDQIHWQMMLTDAKKAYAAIWDWRDSSCIMIEVNIDDEKKERIREEAISFWNMVVNGIAPEASDKDYIEVKDPELEIIVKKYIDITKEEKIIKEKKRSLKEKIEDFGDDGSFQAYGLKVKRCQPAVSYDLEKMKEDGIDIDKYKKIKDSIGFYKIMIPKNLM